MKQESLQLRHILAEKQASLTENISYLRAQACIQINRQHCKFSYIKVNSAILGSFLKIENTCNFDQMKEAETCIPALQDYPFSFYYNTVSRRNLTDCY